jgi:Arf-GAP/SH3 domain/ANK repeat/PH domain-containing protein
MPGVITVPDFIRETKEDYSSPTTSTFVNRIPQCRETVNKVEEALSQDKDSLMKLKKSVKDIQQSGTNHVNLEMELSKALDKMGDMAITRDDEEDDIGAAFQKFAVVTKELSALMRNLMQNLTNIILFPAENILKTELRGSKGDLKRPFDRAWRDYHDRFSELERIKKKQAKDAGMIRSELTAGEIAEDLEKERKYLQIATADYMIKVNEIKTKKGVELLQHLVDYYRAQSSYFTDGLKTIEHFGTYIQELTVKLNHIRTSQDDEKRSLIEIRNSLKNSPGFNKMNGNISTSQYTLHQAKGDAKAGHRKSGYLLKRSEGRLRNVWQKRRCEVRDGFLKICHADESKVPSQVNLLTCQMKPVLEDRLCFDVVSYNRTYHFQAETDSEREEWMSVLLNSKEVSLNRAFEDNGKSTENHGLVEFQRTLVNYIRNIPSNNVCCDCGGQNDVTWLSTNFGIIVCIECSGIHREMGVHISKIQSLTLDHIGTSQLLVSRTMSNEGFNKIMEARSSRKLHPNSTMEERKEIIRAKYIDKAFIQPYCSSARELYAELENAIDSHSIDDLLQCMGECQQLGCDLTDAIPTSEFNETSLHHAISQETGGSLHIVDFLVQNSSSLDRRTKEGNTPLHYCVIQNQPEAMRLLLRSGASPDVQNNNGKTPLSIARERGYHLCEELLLHALARKKTMFENVNIDWNLSHDDGSTDFSDEETLEDHPRTLTRTPEKKGTRPMSIYTPGMNGENEDSPDNNRSHGSSSDWSRSNTSDSGDSPGSYRNSVMPPPPPPQSKKPSIFSGSNLATHIVGSLKKGKSLTPIPPTTYNTLPSSHTLSHVRTNSDGMISPSPNLSLPPAHKRSPSSDSGNAGSRSNTPVSYHMVSGKHLTSPKNKGPPPLKSFHEEPSPKMRMINGQSTESLESLSDELASNSGGNNQNPDPSTRRRPEYHRYKRCRALYDCEADNEDELSFEEGDIIIIIAEETEDDNWMEGILETNPDNRGLFPASFVHMLSD